jgi:hypothetical protein
VASSLDGVADVTVVADLVVHEGTPRRKIAPSLQSRLGTLGPRLFRAVTGGVTVAPRCLWGVSVGAPPVGGGHHLGQSGERSAAPRGQTLGLLFKGDADEPLHLV